jgi:hypothetical protein
MKHKTWFRLAMKLIGILLIGFGLPQFVTDAVNYISWREWYLAQGRTPDGALPEWLSIALTLMPSGLQSAFGVYLLAGGGWIIDKCIPSNRPYCPECGYDLTHTKSEACPECGTAAPRRGANSSTHD